MKKCIFLEISFLTLIQDDAKLLESLWFVALSLLEILSNEATGESRESIFYFLTQTRAQCWSQIKDLMPVLFLNLKEGHELNPTSRGENT